MIRLAVTLYLTLSVLGGALSYIPGIGSKGAEMQDVRVATYSTGKVNTAGYEGLSFWIKDNKRAYIRYAHGVDNEDQDLTYMGLVNIRGERAFKAQFPAPDSNSFYIVQNGLGLTVEDGSGKYLKLYAWEDERKTGDSTVDCSICPEDEKDAMNIMNTYFFH
jgi:hypothetical protein